MKAILISLILFSFCYNQLHASGFAPDEISTPVTVQSDTCDIIEMIELSRRCDGDFHYLTIDLISDNTGSQFTVFRNGVFHRSFSYENLPVEIGPFENSASGESTLFFEDKVFAGCIHTTTYTEPNCAGCELNSLAYIITNCRDGEFHLNFLHLDHQNTNDSFLLIVNDQLIDTFGYNGFPHIIGPFADIHDEYEVYLYDMMQLDCFHYFSFPSPICYPIECELKNLTVAQTECINEEYNLIIDFDYQGNSPFFELWIDNEYIADYRYTALPLTYGPLTTPSGSLSHFIQVVDKDDQLCFDSQQINIQDCRLYCGISGLVVRQINCENGTYELSVNFNHENASSEFNLVVDGRNEGIFSYTELPLLLGPFNSTGSKTIIVSVTDSEDGNCSGSTSLLLEDCRPECSIYNVSYTELPCEGDEFDIVIDFDHLFTSNNFSIFSIDGSEDYGTFSYNQLPLTIGPFPGDGTSRAILTILDSSGDCEEFLTVNPVQCLVYNKERTTEKTLRIIPNPVSNDFTIENITNGRVELLSASGIVIQSWNEYDRNYILNDISSGLYIVRWSSDNEVRYGRMIVISR